MANAPISLLEAFEELSDPRSRECAYQLDELLLAAISTDTVWLADPSLGNRTYSKAQFLEMWETRANSDLRGKILAILPENADVITLNGFFTKSPHRQTTEAVNQLAFRVR